MGMHILLCIQCDIQHHFHSLNTRGTRPHHNHYREKLHQLDKPLNTVYQHMICIIQYHHYPAKNESLLNLETHREMLTKVHKFCVSELLKEIVKKYLILTPIAEMDNMVVLQKEKSHQNHKQLPLRAAWIQSNNQGGPKLEIVAILD